MRYKEMIEEAKSKGLTSEKTMWESVEDIDELLCEMKAEHPDRYHKFMRKQHGIIYGNHYDEHWALKDVRNMKPHGEYWTPSQVKEATKGLSFNGANEWDIYVAYNATANDLHGIIKDEEMLKVAYAFWFADIDWEGAGKIWRYMCMSRK